jgi:hypothetical protein
MGAAPMVSGKPNGSSLLLGVSGECPCYAAPVTWRATWASGGMADAHGSGPCVRKDVGVQLPPRPPFTQHYLLPGSDSYPLSSRATLRSGDSTCGALQFI